MDVGGNPITTVTGAHNTVLSDATGIISAFNNNNPQAGSVATDPNATTPKGTLFQFGDQLLLYDPVAGENDPLGLRSVQDYCSACGVGSYGAPNYDPQSVAHIDMYSSSPSCTGVSDYGYRQVFRLR